mgnify:CR=1 FL=1
MENNKPKRRRARKPDGQFRGDNPNTPDVNEAWESTEMEAALPKEENKYAVKQTVDKPTSAEAGNYKRAEKVRPRMNKVSTTYH